ncbi:MAG: phosphoglycerol geranylgeranyltransferase [Halobacteriota archaeon]
MTIEQQLEAAIDRDGTIHLTLIDPDSQLPEEAGHIAHRAEQGGTVAILVGGSVGVGGRGLEITVNEIKDNTDVPVIIFPSDTGSVCSRADAIFFLSLLNSRLVAYLTTNQALGAVFIKSYGIEPIPVAYIIVEPGGTVGWVGDARLIPRNKPEIAAAYALAGKYLGMRWIYLEAGSGVSDVVPPEMVSAVKDALEDTKLIVGGGIKTDKQAKLLARAGADVIVTGTAIEQDDDVQARIAGFVRAIRRQ